MTILTFTVDDQCCTLKQGRIEDTWWTIRTITNEIAGLVIIYVDDFLICAELQIIDAIEEMWQTGGLQVIGKGMPVRFLGVEIEEIEGGFTMGQRAYIEELLRLHNISETALNRIPVPRDLANFEVDEAVVPNAQAIKEAQQYAGELLWVSQRTRPDVAFASSLVASLSTRDPDRVAMITERTLGFLQRTKHWTLTFAADCTELQGYAGASFAPSGARSHQGVAIFLYDCPVMWKSGRQSTTSISTAECELGAELDGALALLSNGAMLEDLALGALSKRLWCDSTSAISISKGSSSWRTRHLRVKALWLQERLNAGDLELGHIEGRYQLADLLTKALTSSRIWELARLWGLGPREPEEEDGPTTQVALQASRASFRQDQAARVMTVMLWCMMVVRTGSRNVDDHEEPQPSRSLELDSDMASMLVLLLVIGGILAAWEVLKWLGYELVITWTPGAKERKMRRLKRLREATTLAIRDELRARKEKGQRDRDVDDEIARELGLPQRQGPERSANPEAEASPPAPPCSTWDVPPPPPPYPESSRAARRSNTQYVPVSPANIFVIDDSDKYHAYTNCAGLRRLTKPLLYRQPCTFCKDRAQAERAIPLLG